MPWDLNNIEPIYLQLMERIQQEIIVGTYKPGDKLPSVRDLAMEAAVNPNTMQKALAELERLGLVFAHRTSGRYITDDVTTIDKLKDDLAMKHIREFLVSMKNMGLSDDEILQLIKQAVGKGEER